jgi:hypothetical protein
MAGDFVLDGIKNKKFFLGLISAGGRVEKMAATKAGMCRQVFSWSKRVGVTEK